VGGNRQKARLSLTDNTPNKVAVSASRPLNCSTCLNPKARRFTSRKFRRNAERLWFSILDAALEILFKKRRTLYYPELHSYYTELFILYFNGKSQ
jgi:hypothetical protein